MAATCCTCKPCKSLHVCQARSAEIPIHVQNEHCTCTWKAVEEAADHSGLYLVQFTVVNCSQYNRNRASEDPGPGGGSE